MRACVCACMYVCVLVCVCVFVYLFECVQGQGGAMQTSAAI